MDNEGSGLLVIYAFLLIVIWLLIAVVASFLAPTDRRVTFFWLTFLLLGR
jgi:hypothetical protein